VNQVTLWSDRVLSNGAYRLRITGILWNMDCRCIKNVPLATGGQARLQPAEMPPYFCGGNEVFWGEVDWEWWTADPILT